MSKSWFSIKAKADSADISIFDEIGFYGVTAKDFISELRQHSGKAINMQINSPGGSVFDALAIYNALRGHGSTINVKIMGIAASAASLIAMAGDKIVMPENTFMMVHNPWAFAMGNADELRDFADTLDKIGSSLVTTYTARTGLSEDDVKSLLSAETWMTADEAVGFGFADEVEPALRIAASFDTDRLPDNIKAVFNAGNQAPASASASADAAGSQGAADDASTGEPEPAQDTFAKQVSDMAVAAGMADYLSVFLLAGDLDTADKAHAAINTAREVKSLCDTAKLPDMAAQLIRSRSTMAEARAALCDALASRDEQTHTSNIIPLSNSKPANPAQPAALKTADIWAARRLH